MIVTVNPGKAAKTHIPDCSEAHQRRRRDGQLQLISVGVRSVCVFFSGQNEESCATMLCSTGMDDALNSPVLDLPIELRSYCHFPSVRNLSNRIIPDFFCRLQRCVHWESFVQQGLDHSTDLVVIEGRRGDCWPNSKRARSMCKQE